MGSRYRADTRISTLFTKQSEHAHPGARNANELTYATQNRRLIIVETFRLAEHKILSADKASESEEPERKSVHKRWSKIRNLGGALKMKERCFEYYQAQSAA